MAAEPRHRHPLPLVGPLGRAPGQHHEHRQKRQRHREHDGRAPVDRQHGKQDGDGQHGNGRGSRQPLPPVGLDAGDGVGQRRHKIAGCRAGKPHRPERGDLIEKAGKQALSCPRRRLETDLGTSITDRGLEDGDTEKLQEPRQDRGKVGTAKNRRVENAGGDEGCGHPKQTLGNGSGKKQRRLLSHTGRKIVEKGLGFTHAGTRPVMRYGKPDCHAPAGTARAVAFTWARSKKRGGRHGRRDDRAGHSERPAEDGNRPWKARRFARRADLAIWRRRCRGRPGIRTT